MNFIIAQDQRFFFLGHAETIKTGLKKSKYECIFTIDGDGEFDVNELVIMKSDVFHLDTLFTPVINKKNQLAAMIACTSLMENESAVNLKNFAKKLSIELIEVDPEDSIGTNNQLGEFAVNCCPLPGYLIGPTRFRSLKVNKMLKELEVMHITIPTTQFRLSGGSVHCLTNEL